jgi:hypothetical protein
MPAITIREYNSESGALLGNVSILNFGRITAGTTSAVKVIDIAFTGYTQVGNIKLGLVSTGGLTVNSNPTDIASDGSAGNGHFGIESTASFDAAKASSVLSRHFAGSNSTSIASSTNNVSIPNRTGTISNYIYLDIEVDAASTEVTNGAYKVFFDYS